MVKRLSDVDQNDNPIVNVPTPVDDTDAANKAYVDDEIAAIPSGSGDVVGPASSTDNAIARYDGTTGKLLQASGVIIDDYNQLIVPAIPGTGAGSLKIYVSGDTDSDSGDIETTGAFGITAENGVNLMSNTASVYVYSTTNFLIDAPATAVNTIVERTSNAGVTIDGVLIKDNAIYANEGYFNNNFEVYANGYFADNLNVDGNLKVYGDVQAINIIEVDPDTGVTIDGVLIKDGLVDGVDVATLAPTASPTFTGTVTLPDNTSVNHLTIKPTFEGGSASLFLNNDEGQTWEFFANNGGSFGVYDQANSKQPLTIDPNTASDTLKMSPTGVNVGGILKADTVNENTSDAGVTIEGVLLKDGIVNDRIGTTASAAAPAPLASTHDQYNVTALAEGATFASPGTGIDGQELTLRIKDDGTARSLAFNAVYRFSTDLAAPTTTVISKTLYMKFKYNDADSKWDCLAWLNNF